MEIVLKNGEKINLEWNPIVIEYLEEYEGGLEQLRNDLAENKIPFRVFNFIIYCFINAVYSRELGYREAVSLVNPNDLSRIIDFVVENINSFSATNEEKIEKTNQSFSLKHRR